ncbi:MAG: tetratricopeptide repeat protein [Ktedonobacteraceae bacterium]|nr:tetratricopeptide repeat protein [Ktedonobacteraceae bacterium]
MRPSISLFLCKQLAWALEKEQEAFKEHQAAVKAVDVAQNQAKNTLDGLHKDNNDQYGWLRGIAGSGLITLLRMVPGANVVLSDKQVAEKAQEVLGEGAVVGATQLTHVYTRLRNKLGQRLDDYLNPALRLGLALGRDLGKFARNQPLLFLFDTYEEVDEADALLRVVMVAAGARVGWIVAGRDNLWAGMEQRKRTIGKVYGYKDIVPSDRCLAVDFNAGGVGAFSANDIVTYFDILQARLPDFPMQVALSENDAEQIVEVTQGVPLAVKIAAGLFVETADLEVVTRKSDRKREIIDEMFLRYLLHVRDDESERTRLYGLALLRRADEPFAVAAALHLSTEQAKTGYERELIRLHRRYSFIFTEKEQPTLHQEVRYFLRLWLKEHRRNPEVEAVALRLNAAHEQVLQRLEEQWNYTSLRARLEDQEWVETYLDLTEQRFWLDPTYAVAYYNRGVTYDNLKEHERAMVDYTEAIRLDPTYAFAYYNRGLAYTTLEDYEAALKDYTRSLELNPHDAYIYNDRALAYIAVVEYAKALADFNQAIEIGKDVALFYSNRAWIYGKLAEYQKALIDYGHAIDLQPDDANTYISRGYIYLHLQNQEEAYKDFVLAAECNQEDVNAAWMVMYASFGKGRPGPEVAQRLVEIARIDPQRYEAATCRGIALGLQGKLREGLAEIEQAIVMSQNEPGQTQDAYFWKGMLCAYIGRNQAAIEAVEKALEEGLPPILLIPLHWLERDRPEFYERYAAPLLTRYNI